MRQILVYADSLSWGIIPLTRDRLSFDSRSPGVMAYGLNAQGAAVCDVNHSGQVQSQDCGAPVGPTHLAVGLIVLLSPLNDRIWRK